jgi:hypothetical protein
MARPTAVCKMCLQPRLLESSHLIPSAIYDYCRPPGGDPLAFTTEFILPSSRQTQDYLLCSDCEDILNKGGEKWLNPKLATYEKTFQLYDLLAAAPPIFDEGDFTVYAAAQNPNIKVSDIVHFGMGIFWKAAVHSWTKDSGEPRIKLGPYAERIRLFLRGEGSFPDNIVLTPVLATPGSATIALNLPYECVRQGGYRTFFFCVPGIQFTMYVGKLISPEARTMCIQRNPDGPIAVSALVTNKGKAVMSGVLRGARKTKSYEEYMRKLGVTVK